MRLRLLEVEDVPHCLSAWPFPGVSNDLALPVVERGLAEGRLQGTIIEDPANGAMLAFGLSGFVGGANLDGAERWLQPLVASLLQAEAAGARPLLAPQAQCAAALANDLNLVVLAYRQHTFDSHLQHARAVLAAGHAAYRLLHEGYPLRSVWQEGDAADEAWMCAGGMKVKQVYPSATGPGRILCGVRSEDIDSPWPSHTVSFLFRRTVNQLRLTPMQRRVAHLALWNLSDEQTARRLEISPETVRQHWRGIFERVQGTHPGILAAPTHNDAPTGRGPEKRGRVLEFLRGNLHEVRPMS
jgi:DNA-binding CsgD family transcriptional regulator